MNCSVLKLTPLERNTKSLLTAIKRKDSNARQIEDTEFSVMLLKLLFVWELGENEIVSLSAEKVFAEIGYIETDMLLRKGTWEFGMLRRF